MTDSEVAEMENLKARLELSNRELARLKIALGVIEREHFRERVEALEQAGDALATELDSFHSARECETLRAWLTLRTLPVVSDPDITPTGEIK